MAKLGERKYADCLLLVGEEQKEIYASRAILARNCAYFDSMFSSGMAESEAFDKKTGQLNPISMPDENYDVFYLFMQMLYGDVTRFKDDITPEAFGKLADLMDKYQIESGPFVGACTELLVAKVSDKNFFEYLVAYRGLHGTRPVALSVMTNMQAAARDNKFYSSTPLFIAKCTAEDLNLIAAGYCGRDKITALDPEVCEFVHSCLIPAVGRIAKKKAVYIGDVDVALDFDPVFAVKETRTVTLDQKEAEHLLGSGHGHDLQRDFLLKSGVELCWDSDHHLVMRVHFAGHVYVTIADSVKHNTTTKVPTKQLDVQLDIHCSELERLKAANAGFPELKIEFKLHYVQTLLQIYMLQHLSTISFARATPSFMDMLSSPSFSVCWDKKLDAATLVDKLIEYTTTQNSDRPVTSGCLKTLFTNSVPWIYVQPARLLRCMRLKDKYTGMSPTDWAKIQCELASPQPLVGVRNVRLPPGERVNDIVAMGAAMVEAIRGSKKKKRKAEVDEDEKKSSNKKARTGEAAME